jgi:DNA-binding MarR family transcriptional regulator
MSSAARRIARAKERQAAREKAKALTRRGLCSRCQQPRELHREGDCPDGGGTFSWALGREDMDRVIARLERAQAESRAHQGVELTRDERSVLDALVDFTLGSRTGGDQEFAIASFLLAPEPLTRPGLRPEQLAERTGLPLHHVRALLRSLIDKGYLQQSTGSVPS